MEEEKDIRWKQRFQNLEKAMEWLEEGVRRVADAPNDAFLRTGLIQCFEFTFELSWKTMKDYLFEEGIEVKSPKETIRQAIQINLIKDDDNWMKALSARNLTTHIYEEEEIKEIADSITTVYFPMIDDFIKSLRERL